MKLCHRKSTEGQTPAAPPYRRPPHGEAVPQSAARRGRKSGARTSNPEGRSYVKSTSEPMVLLGVLI